MSRVVMKKGCWAPLNFVVYLSGLSEGPERHQREKMTFRGQSLEWAREDRVTTWRDGCGVTLRLVSLGVHGVDLHSGKGTGAEPSFPHRQTCSSYSGPHLPSITWLLRPQTLESS